MKSRTQANGVGAHIEYLAIETCPLFSEIENADVTWRALLDRLPELKDLVPRCESLGQEIADAAPVLDAFVAGYSDLTLIHGDCKGWNFFFGKEDPGQVALIDMQWMGKGHPLQVCPAPEGSTFALLALFTLL